MRLITTLSVLIPAVGASSCWSHKSGCNDCRTLSMCNWCPLGGTFPCDNGNIHVRSNCHDPSQCFGPDCVKEQCPAPPSPCPPPKPQPYGPGAGAWDLVQPKCVNLSAPALDQANTFINNAVVGRQCFLLIKDGKLAYEWYNNHTLPPGVKPPERPGSPTTCHLSLVKQTSSSACTAGKSFGCYGSNTMFVTLGCAGTFQCGEKRVYCQSPEAQWRACACDLENTPQEGYSMTKTIGGFLIFMAVNDGLDIDADITKKYKTPSPKPYPVTLRMMMAQVLGGNHRPGEMWRYDEMGDMWMHLMPKIILAATGHNASYYFEAMKKELGLSKYFTWPSVNVAWFRGAAGTCRDWARFGQLILNNGYWGDKQLIAAKLIEDMQKPQKIFPYNYYSNPCYGLLVWRNADKAKHPGCCWEASRLPNPKCNDDTFMPGAVNDLTLIIGLYGGLVMTLPSVNTVVVGFGVDLRPIEPARIGYYPAVCKALNISCNVPPPLPPTKCGERLECTGMSAQCFSGGAWNHSEPVPGKQECIDCFQNRLPAYEKQFPEAHAMAKTYCPVATPANPYAAQNYIKCFCNTNSNPFAPWPTTTTTTLAPSPCPPAPPPGPTPAPPKPPPMCELSPGCINALRQKCPHDGGQKCYECLARELKSLTAAGCPSFKEEGFFSRAFCWCGILGTSVELV